MPTFLFLFINVPLARKYTAQNEVFIQNLTNVSLIFAASPSILLSNPFILSKQSHPPL